MQHQAATIYLHFRDYSTENLRYLSIDQALEDVAYFIKYQKATIPGLSNSKVVVVGGSYSATMATWAREKYPHLIDVAYASSAPLKAIKDFHGICPFIIKFP